MELLRDGLSMISLPQQKYRVIKYRVRTPLLGFDRRIAEIEQLDLRSFLLFRHDLSLDEATVLRRCQRCKVREQTSIYLVKDGEIFLHSAVSY
jgi:hypothetical protein